MPLPPPPAAAFSITGSPSLRTIPAISGASSLGILLPGTVGTPAASASRLAEALSPSRSITSGVGTNEDEARGFDGARERCIFGEKAKTGMNRLRA